MSILQKELSQHESMLSFALLIVLYVADVGAISTNNELEEGYILILSGGRSMYVRSNETVNGRYLCYSLDNAWFSNPSEPCSLGVGRYDGLFAQSGTRIYPEQHGATNQWTAEQLTPFDKTQLALFWYAYSNDESAPSFASAIEEPDEDHVTIASQGQRITVGVDEVLSVDFVDAALGGQGASSCTHTLYTQSLTSVGASSTGWSVELLQQVRGRIVGINCRADRQSNAYMLRPI